MEKTSRRNILKAVAAGSAAAGLGMVMRPSPPESVYAQGRSGESHGRGHNPIDGPLASATVSFGQWRTDMTPPLDRLTNAPPAPPTNQHLLIPYEPMIKAGGSVNFIIAGLHNVVIYDHGTEPDDINTALLINMANPPNLPLINDPNKRIYRGPDPSLVPLDRVEVVTFSRPGRYLVICGFLFHFQEKMWGYVKVV